MKKIKTLPSFEESLTLLRDKFNQIDEEFEEIEAQVEALKLNGGYDTKHDMIIIERIDLIWDKITNIDAGIKVLIEKLNVLNNNK